MKLVSVETPEKSVCKMTFSATAEELEAASNAVYERTRATYTIKGFQKGEADRAQIELTAASTPSGTMHQRPDGSGCACFVRGCFEGTRLCAGG